MGDLLARRWRALYRLRGRQASLSGPGNEPHRLRPPSHAAARGVRLRGAGRHGAAGRRPGGRAAGPARDARRGHGPARRAGRQPAAQDRWRSASDDPRRCRRAASSSSSGRRAIRSTRRASRWPSRIRGAAPPGPPERVVEATGRPAGRATPARPRCWRPLAGPKMPAGRPGPAAGVSTGRREGPGGRGRAWRCGWIEPDAQLRRPRPVAARAIRSTPARRPPPGR